MTQPTASAGPQCRHCDQLLDVSLVDLGVSPPCNTLIRPEDIHKGEMFYPLHAQVCTNCFLVQVGDSEAPDEIFSEYSYFSSFSASWVEHAKSYVHAVTDRFGLDSKTKVMEVASNDGYLLQHFLPLQIPVLGIEPAKNIAEVAIGKGIPTISEFLGVETAKAIVAEHGHAALVAANNVMAHTPYLNDFVQGLTILAGQNGVITVEFPHLLRLMDENQFDTIYHEHFSYFSLFTVEKLFQANDFHIFDVDTLTTHGGSLRIYACAKSASHASTPAVADLREEERLWGVDNPATYMTFTPRVEKVKRDLLNFLIEARENGKQVVGYGAPGKGNTLLNYAGIRTDLVQYLVDLNPYKQDNYTPGTRIPIKAPEEIFSTQPDYVLIMPWNLKDEIVQQLEDIRAWGGQFVVAIPELTIIP